MHNDLPANFAWYDYGARFYDVQLGRFTGIDPIAEDYYYITPYNYAENSPIANIDFTFEQSDIDDLTLMGQNNFTEDCWKTYRSTAATLTGDESINDMSYTNGKLTNYLKDNNYLHNDLLTYWNSNREGDANYGFSTLPTNLLENNTDQGDGKYIFAGQISRQYHNVTVILDKSNGNTNFMAYDQGTGRFNKTPTSYSSDVLNSKFEELNIRRIDYHFGAGKGENIHSRFIQYGIPKKRIVSYPYNH